MPSLLPAPPSSIFDNPRLVRSESLSSVRSTVKALTFTSCSMPRMSSRVGHIATVALLQLICLGNVRSVKSGRDVPGQTELEVDLAGGENHVMKKYGGVQLVRINAHIAKFP